MTTQNIHRIAHPGWTTVAKRNTRRPPQQKPRIDPRIANQLARNWSVHIKENRTKITHTYPFSAKEGETWADDVERAEEEGWVSGWPPCTQAKRRVQPMSWADAAK